MRACTVLLSLVFCCPLLRADTLYAASPSGLYSVDTVHSTATLLSHTPTWYDIALAPDGALFASDSSRLFRVDPVTGGTVLVGPMHAFINAMTFVGPTLYGAGDLGLYTIDPATAVAHFVGSTGFVSSGDLELFAGTLYLTAMSGSGSDLLVRIDPLTGHGILVGPIGFSQVMGLAATPGGLYGLTGAGDLLWIDAAAGTGTKVGSLGISVYGATAGSVPEPGTLFLLGSGLLALARRIHKR